MPWTPDQQRAIKARGENLLLSAAAGSGKTSVLVERVLALIEEGANVDQMLIITFSRAAAAEMKARLTGALHERAASSACCRRQLERVERASVSTIHAFCIDVLRAHFEAALVDPSFRVLDDAEARQLEARALSETLERACEERPELVAALDFGRDIKQLGAMIAHLYHFAQERPDPERWLDDACRAWPAGDARLWADELLGGARVALDEAEGLIGYALELSASPLGPRVYAPALEDDLRAIAALPGLDYEALRRALMEYEQTRIAPLRVKEDDPDAEARRALGEQVKALRKDAKASIERAQALLPELESALEDMRLSLDALEALRALTLDFGERLQTLEADRSALSFSDLEHAALRALGDPGVGEAIRARFSHVFVDEYQDVSDLQEALIVKVAREGNLFMVGDVKQSIYRFRQAEPTLFIEKYHRYGKGAGGRLIALSHNFRSRPGILALVNRVFERAMSGPDAETPYDDAARLRPGAAFADAEPPIELHLIAPDSKEDSERAELSKAEREGALVAARIRALLLETLPAGDARRPVRPRDIAVIARTRSALAACERMLREAGIPAYADVDGGYFDALEVRIMLSLLELIENRRRDYPLLAVLRSPIGGLTSTELAQVRAARPEGSFRDAMIEYLPRGDETAAKLRALEEDLDRWRALSRALPLGEFVDLLLRETGFYAYAGAMPGGAARQGNLDLLCAYASDFEAAQGGGLTGFLSYVAEVAATGGDLSAAHALGAGDDVVRLMTAHKSKGLEFPIVLAIQLGRSLSARQNAGELKTHRQLGAGLYHHDPTLATRRETIARRAIRLAGERESLEEEKRILYVLLTRAQHRLILVGSQDALGAARRRWEAARRAPIAPQSFLDMIVPALPEMGEAPEIQVTWHEGVRPEGPARAHEAESPPTPAEVRSAIDALSWRYPHEGEAFLPVKLTVSGLSRSLEGAHEAPPMVRRPRFLSGEHATALERGTLIHAAMSALDLRALAARQGALLRAELTGQLKALEKRGVLREAVDPEPIARFFGRELGRRLLAAETVRREWPFNLRMAAREALLVDSDAELMVQGVVDCCFLEDGAWVLLDYKTDRLDDEDAMSKRYGAQLTLYRRALERITGIPVKEVLLCLLGAGRELPVG